MSSNKSSAGFRSVVYRHGEIYNWLNKRLYEWDKKFATVAKLVKQTKYSGPLLKVFELACGTGYLCRYLSRENPPIEYEGWDLNHRFLKKLKLDWSKDRLKVKKIIIKQNNIFDFENYPEDKKDVIVFSGILHHIYPKHEELVENAKKHANRIIACEPYAIRPDEITSLNWYTRLFMNLTKYLPEPLFKVIDYFLADNDGINPYKTRYSWDFNEAGLKEMFQGLGMQKTYTHGDECIGIWEA